MGKQAGGGSSAILFMNTLLEKVCVCMCVCVRACAGACARSRVCARVCVCVRVRVRVMGKHKDERLRRGSKKLFAQAEAKKHVRQDQPKKPFAQPEAKKKKQHQAQAQGSAGPRKTAVDAQAGGASATAERWATGSREKKNKSNWGLHKNVLKAAAAVEDTHVRSSGNGSAERPATGGSAISQARATTAQPGAMTAPSARGGAGKLTTLQAMMKSKMDSAKFRWLNEQLCVWSLPSRSGATVHVLHARCICRRTHPHSMQQRHQLPASRRAPACARTHPHTVPSLTPPPAHAVALAYCDVINPRSHPPSLPPFSSLAAIPPPATTRSRSTRRRRRTGRCTTMVTAARLNLGLRTRCT